MSSALGRTKRAEVTIVEKLDQVEERITARLDRLVEGQDRLVEGQDRLIEGQGRMAEDLRRLLTSQAVIVDRLDKLIEISSKNAGRSRPTS